MRHIIFNVGRAARAIQKLFAGGSAPAPWVAFLCLPKEKRPKERAPRMAQHPPALLASGMAVARQDIPVLAGDQRGPSRCLSGARPEACDARARHTGIPKSSKEQQPLRSILNTNSTFDNR